MEKIEKRKNCIVFLFFFVIFFSCLFSVESRNKKVFISLDVMPEHYCLLVGRGHAETPAVH